MKKREKKLKKKLKNLDCYCLKRFGFSIFDEEVQKMIGVKNTLSVNLRAASAARKMLYVLKDARMSELFSEVLLNIDPKS